MDPRESLEDRIMIQEVVSFLKVRLNKDRESLSRAGGEKGVTDLKEVVKEGTTREEGVLGFMNKWTDKRDKERGEVLSDNPINGIGDSDGPKLLRRG